MAAAQQGNPERLAGWWDKPEKNEMKKGKSKGTGTKGALGTAKSVLESGDNYSALLNTGRRRPIRGNFVVVTTSTTEGTFGKVPGKRKEMWQLRRCCRENLEDLVEKRDFRFQASLSIYN